MSLPNPLGRLPACVLLAASLAASPAVHADGGRNLVIFVADGLRAASVNPEDAPTMAALARSGVHFVNSHAVVPTFTTPNAAAIATGHLPGDTGDYSNSLYPGYAAGDGPTPFVENDAILAELNQHYAGNWLGEESLLALARAHGYSTAAVGKLGPVAIQDVAQLAGPAGQNTAPQTVIIDDATGSAGGVPLADEVVAALRAAGLPVAVPAREQPAGDFAHAGARSANGGQQDWFVAAATRALLPLFRQRGRPFALVYWSRDPDGSQHNQGDSLNVLTPGINGPTSRAGVRDADDNLRRLLEALRAVPGLAENTDVFVTSDHGFATVSRHDVDAQQRATASYAATLAYDDTPPGFLPLGFLAIDLAHALALPLFDPVTRDPADVSRCRLVHPGGGASDSMPQHPLAGGALLGGSGACDAHDAQVIVAANGGSDLLYLPRKDPALLERIIAFLNRQDYVSAVFVDDAYGPLPGTLPLSAVGLHGATALPSPALLVGFRHFLLARDGHRDATSALLYGVQIADTGLQQGQGMHGALARDNTRNFMAAVGPDFRARFVDRAPAGNADIAPTLAASLGWTLPSHGALAGRPLGEALRHDGRMPRWQHCVAVSSPDVTGRRTVLNFQRAAGRRYIDEADFSFDARLAAHCRAPDRAGR